MWLRWLLLGVLGLVAPVEADVTNEPCANQAVVAVGWTQADAVHICLAAERALRALHSIGLPLSGGLLVRPLDEQGIRSNGHPLGRYDARTNEIQILPFDAAVRASHERPPAFGVTMTRELWGSYIAHEMAHAAAESRFSPGTPRITAGEYIAAVVELMVLTDATRDSILASYRDLSGWGSATEINSTWYFINPSAFAVKSYRHFVALPPNDQHQFIERLLRTGLRD